MPRVLVMVTRTVTETERSAYENSLAVRRERAATASANFWVFEQLELRGQFLEFVEAGSREQLDDAMAAIEGGVPGGGSAVPIWKEVVSQG